MSRPSASFVSLIRLHASDESLDQHPAQRTKRIAPVRRQPDLAAQADRVSTGPEKLAAIVERAHAGAGDNRQLDACIAQLSDDAQTHRLDRATRQAAEPVLEQRLACLGMEPQPFPG